MDNITASENERELKVMNEEYENAVESQKINQTNNDIDFFDDTPGAVGNADQPMECQSSAVNKRRLEDSDSVIIQSKSKVRCTPAAVEAVSSLEGNSQTLSEIGNCVQETQEGEVAISNVVRSSPPSLPELSSVSPIISTHNICTPVNRAGTIILIKPEVENPQELINNPVEIVAAIEASKFGKLNIKDIKTNKRKGLLVAKIDHSSPAIVSELINVQCLGKWPVKCYIPNSERYKSGVISPISSMADISKIKEVISRDYNIFAVERLKKKMQNGDWVDSNSIKIVFDTVELPQEIVIGHSFYKVRPFVNQPLQCYRCQRLGHTAEGCKAKIRCLVCAGEHVKEVCTARNEHCANCSGSHKANSKYCNLIKKAYEEQKQKLNNGSWTMSSSSVTPWLSVSDKARSGPNKNVVHADVHQIIETQSSVGFQSYSDIAKRKVQRIVNSATMPRVQRGSYTDRE